MPRRRLTPLALCAAAGLAACAGHGDGGPGVPKGITIVPSAAALCVGDTLTFAAQVVDQSGHPVTGAPIRWSSSAPEAVAIDSVSGVAHALAFGAAQIVAASGALRSADPAALDVPSDLVPEYMPDTVVLAPGDTMTLGARLRRLSGGPAPSRVPVISPFDSTAAGIDSTGLVRAKAAGSAALSLAACGFTGHGAVRVFTAPDSATGVGYLWLSGPAELRLSLPARALNFTTSAAKPAFQVFSKVGTTRAFLYEDTLRLAAPGLFPLDSIFSDSVPGALCRPPRPFANYSDQSPISFLVSMHGGSTTVTTFVAKTGYTAISGRSILRMRGIAGGVLTAVDTLQAIYTFSAPLRDTTGVCP